MDRYEGGCLVVSFPSSQSIQHLGEWCSRLQGGVSLQLWALRLAEEQDLEELIQLLRQARREETIE